MALWLPMFHLSLPVSAAGLGGRRTWKRRLGRAIQQELRHLPAFASLAVREQPRMRG